jgi:hypothetical protein
MVYRWHIGWLSEGKLLLPYVQLDFRPDFKTGANGLHSWLRSGSSGYLQPQQIA